MLAHRGCLRAAAVSARTSRPSSCFDLVVVFSILICVVFISRSDL